MKTRNVRSFRRPSGKGGWTLIEMLTVMAILAILSALTMPAILDLAGGLKLRLAAQRVAGTLRAARSYAVRHNAKVAVKFHTEEDPTTFALYRDGDRDGVRNTDIADGTDPMVWAKRRLNYLPGDVRIGFPPGRPPREPGDPRRRMKRRDDPVRFNRSDLASFSPTGTATPGSVYLTDARHRLAVVRVNNVSGKVTVLVYDQEKDAWGR